MSNLSWSPETFRVVATHANARLAHYFIVIRHNDNVQEIKASYVSFCGFLSRICAPAKSLFNRHNIVKAQKSLVFPRFSHRTENNLVFHRETPNSQNHEFRTLFSRRYWRGETPVKRRKTVANSWGLVKPVCRATWATWRFVVNSSRACSILAR